jgi:DNA-binding transcriptional LysR family regulator
LIAERVIRDGDARIGVGWRRMDSTGLRQIHVGGVRYIPVAAPDRPLAAAADIWPLAPREHIQLVLSEQPAREGWDFGVLSLTSWRVGDLAANHKLLGGQITFSCSVSCFLPIDAGAS